MLEIYTLVCPPVQQIYTLVCFLCCLFRRHLISQSAMQSLTSFIQKCISQLPFMPCMKTKRDPPRVREEAPLIILFGDSNFFYDGTRVTWLRWLECCCGKNPNVADIIKAYLKAEGFKVVRFRARDWKGFQDKHAMIVTDFTAYHRGRRVAVLWVGQNDAHDASRASAKDPTDHIQSFVEHATNNIQWFENFWNQIDVERMWVLPVR